jgi:hypothetical protein
MPRIYSSFIGKKDNCGGTGLKSRRASDFSVGRRLPLWAPRKVMNLGVGDLDDLHSELAAGDDHLDGVADLFS